MTARNVGRAVLALAASLSLATGTATAAHADAFRHRDATGDVNVVTSDDFDTTYVTAPNQRRPDIQQFTVLHGRWALSIETTLRGLESTSGSRWSAIIRTSKGDLFMVSRIISPGDGGVPQVVVRRNTYTFTCAGVSVNRTSSGVVAKLPTRCLGNPWKVRVGVEAFTTFRVSDPQRFGEDDALDTAGKDSTFARDPRFLTRLSPWLAR